MSKANEAEKKFDSLAGREKAAVVLLALGEERAAEVMGKLDEVELPTVTRAMSSCGKLSPDMSRDAAMALMERLSSGAAVSGGAMSAERMLSRFLPADRVSEIMTEIRGPAGRTTWEKLSNVNEQVLANYLRAEYPQTVAVVMSRLRPDHAATENGRASWWERVCRYV